MDKVAGLLTLIGLVVIVLMIGAYTDFDPFNDACSWLPFCDPEEEPDNSEPEVVNSEVLWEAVHTRLVLNTKLYERRTKQEVEEGLLKLTMEATTNITIGVNLQDIEQSNIVVDHNAKRVVMNLSNPQPIDCTLSDVKYSGELCLEDDPLFGANCKPLRDEAVRMAFEEAFASDNYQQALEDARGVTRDGLEAFIAPLIPEDYILIVQYSNLTPTPIENATCNQYR